MIKIIFAYKIGEKVRIKASGRSGIVQGLWIGEGDVKKYDVRYTDKNGLIANAYFTGEELKR